MEVKVTVWPAVGAAGEEVKSAASAPDTCTVKYLSADFMNAASRARAKLGCSISSILLGIYSAALLRVLDMPELLMMTQIDVRTKSQRDAMGMMINTVPVHIKLDGEARWTEFLAAEDRTASAWAALRAQPA